MLVLSHWAILAVILVASLVALRANKITAPSARAVRATRIVSMLLLAVSCALLLND